MEIAKPLGKTVVFKENAGTWDIAKAIIQSTPEAKRQLKEFSKKFKTPKQVHDWIVSNVQYKMDGNKLQDIRFPSRLYHDAYGDCKSMSLFIAGCLENMKVPHRFVFTSYDPNDPTPTHVYIETMDGIVIDPVYTIFGGKYGKEKPYYKKYAMQVRGLYGFPGQKPINGKLSDALKRAGEGIKKFAADAKDVVTGDQTIKEALTRDSGVNSLARLAPPMILARGAFLGLVRINARGLATALKKKHDTGQYGPILDLWEKKFGGYFAELRDAFNAGATKRPLFGNFKLAGVRTRGIGVTGVEEVLAMIAAALPIVVAIVPMVKGDMPQEPAGGSEIPPLDDPTGSGGSIIPGVDNTFLLLGGAALAAFLILRKKKKK